MESSEYHNTMLLLQQYRSAAWSIELELSQICDSSPMHFDGSFEERLSSIEDIGVSYYGASLERQAANMRLTWQMIRLIDQSVSSIRFRHPKGELYFQILHYSYLSPDGPLPLKDILQQLEALGFYMAARSFYRYRKKAVELLGTVLWGYTTRECLDILQQYLKQL